MVFVTLTLTQIVKASVTEKWMQTPTPSWILTTSQILTQTVDLLLYLQSKSGHGQASTGESGSLLLVHCLSLSLTKAHQHNNAKSKNWHHGGARPHGIGGASSFKIFREIGGPKLTFFFVSFDEDHVVFL